MQVNRNNNKAILWFFIVIGLIVGLYLYLTSRNKVKNANEELSNHLEERKDALNDIYYNVVTYRKSKVEIVVAKKRTSVFLRCFISTVILLLNWWYIGLCYPHDLTIQHIFECIANFNAVLLFLTGLITFAFWGSFFEVRNVYHTIQTYTLTWLFKKDEETIESLLKLNLENRDSIRKEILETEMAIKQNEELLASFKVDDKEHSTD